jgi:hypothetical protein
MGKRVLFTGRRIDIFGFKLQLHPRQRMLIYNQKTRQDIKHTDPLMGPSWADLPFTLKVTPFGALDLTSRAAADRVSRDTSLSTDGMGMGNDLLALVW